MNKPKLLVNIIPICSESNNVFIGKRLDDMKVNIVSGKLKYGEEFNTAAGRLIKDDLGLGINDLDRFKFLCTYNIIEKEKDIHFVGVMFYIDLNKEETKWVSINKYTFTSWVFATVEDIVNYKNDCYIALKSFIEKFEIKNIDNIRSIVSN